MIGKVGGSLVLLGLGVTLAACGAAPSPAQSQPANGATVNSTASNTAAGNSTAGSNTANNAPIKATVSSAGPVYVEFAPVPAAEKPAELDIYNHTELIGDHLVVVGRHQGAGFGCAAQQQLHPGLRIRP